MDLHIRLWTWRTHLDLTLQAVADQSGVSQPLLSKIECGHTGVRYVLLDAIVTKGLGLDWHKFTGRLPKVRIPTKPQSGRPRTVSKPTIGARAA